MRRALIIVIVHFMLSGCQEKITIKKGEFVSVGPYKLDADGKKIPVGEWEQKSLIDDSIWVGKYEFGKKVGPWFKTDKDGKKIEMKTYGDEEYLTGTSRKWDKGGQLVLEEEYTNGKLNGSRKKWYGNGKLMEEMPYIDGKKSGKYSAFTESGGKKYEVIFFEGKEHGLATIWYDSGKVHEKHMFISGRDVSWKKFDANGVVVGGTDYFPTNITIGKLLWENPAISPRKEADTSVVDKGTKQYTFDEASRYCSDLKLDGFEDWRLPTLMELGSLLRGCMPNRLLKNFCTPGKKCDLDSISATVSCGVMGPRDSDGCYWPAEFYGPCGQYWSSEKGENYIWVVSFEKGWPRRVPLDDEILVRCVHDISG